MHAGGRRDRFDLIVTFLIWLVTTHGTYFEHATSLDVTNALSSCVHKVQVGTSDALVLLLTPSDYSCVIQEDSFELYH